MDKATQLPVGYCRRPNGTLHLRFTYQGKRRSIYGKSVRECEWKRMNTITAISRAGGNKNRLTLSEYYRIWNDRRRNTCKESTLCVTEEKYRRIKNSLGNLQLQSITRKDIYQLQDKLLKRGLCTTTVNATLALLRMILESAVHDGLLEENPCSHIEQLKANGLEARETVHRALTDTELARFFRQISGKPYYDLCRLLLSTGMRAGEALALQWEDIDFENRVITVRKSLTRTSGGGWRIGTPKTKCSRRSIPITGGIEEILLAIAAEAVRDENATGIPEPEQFLFTLENGAMLTVSNFDNQLTRQIRLAGLRHFSSHAFRDTFATKAIEAGMRPETLQGILGHATIGMTMNLYYHLRDEKKYAEMNLIKIEV